MHFAAGNGSPGFDIGMREALGGEFAATLRHTLLFASPAERIPDCMIDAARHKFADHQVIHVHDLHSACGPFTNPVAVVLIDASYLTVIEHYAPLIKKHHPAATLVLTHDERWNSAAAMRRMIAAGAFNSILPMSLPLHLWLQVIQVLLDGGDYLPAKVVRDWLGTPPVDGEAGRHAHSLPRRDPRANESLRAAPLSALTEREMEILALVAEGHQNKIIAVKCNLSEHTVKVHLHNIIKKLGTSNRTRAAALYLAEVPINQAPT
jgi:DNA-binding NarL/FixJ family response regulator